MQAELEIVLSPLMLHEDELDAGLFSNRLADVLDLQSLMEIFQRAPLLQVLRRSI